MNSKNIHMINQISPLIEDDDIKSVYNVIKSTYVSEGQITSKYEKLISKLHKSPNQSIAYCNATSALYSCLITSGIKKNKYVLVPALNFISSVNAILFANYKPILCDITDNFEFDYIHLKFLLNKFDIGCVVPTHLYGHMMDIKKLKKNIKKDIIIIEDASQAVGLKDKYGNMSGSFSDIAIFSFYANKIITSAQGGAIISKNKSWLQKLRYFKNHGRIQKGTFIHEQTGLNFCTSDLHSALGLSQLKKLNKIKSLKNKIFKRYFKGLPKTKSFYLDVINSTSPFYWFFSVFCEDADHLQRFLARKGIETRRSFTPINLQPCYKNYKFKNISNSNFPKSQKIYNRYLSLPSSCNLNIKDQNYIIKQIKLWLTESKI